ncbi:MAG: hypothetical protein ACUVWQ_04390, partial [Candidatus Aminicenantales bacterium]
FFFLGFVSLGHLQAQQLNKNAIAHSAGNKDSRASSSRVFFYANAMINLFFNAKSEFNRPFMAYGEEGAVSQTYSLKSALSWEASGGRYLRFGRFPLKVGLGFNLIPLKTTGNYRISVPHPLIEQKPRYLQFSDSFKNNIFHIYGYAFINLLWRPLELSLGPIFGLARGKFPALSDLEIEDKSPFRSSDLSLTVKTLGETAFTRFTLGAGGHLAFFLDPNLALMLAYKMISLKPFIKDLSGRVDLSHHQFSVVIQFQF